MTIYLVDTDSSCCKEFNNQPIVIDGANVAFENVLKDQKAKFSNLVLLKHLLEINGITNYIVFCDRSLHYKIDETKKYDDLIKHNPSFYETPGGTQADHFILQHAFKSNGLIISNDNFRDFFTIYEKDWIISHRISFCIINNEINFDKLIIK